MRFYKPKRRTRLMLAGFLLLVAMATPLAVDLAHPSSLHGVRPGTVGVYASGITALDTAAIVALPLAAIFVLWLIRGEQREVNVRILNQRARNRQNFINGLRTLLVVGGGAGLIVGSLAAIYAILTAIEPNLAVMRAFPLTFNLALPCLVAGGLVYALGKIGRRYD
ncbi:MAG: hypothetical protein ABI740_07275 [Alphaproteobacteria bacterium]